MQPSNVSATRSTLPRAYRSPRAWVILLAVFLCGVGIDLASKSLAFSRVAERPIELDREHILSQPGFRVPRHRPQPVLGGHLLELQLVVNHGAVFGIGARQRGFFIFFTILALGAGIFVFTRWTLVGDTLAHGAIGLVLAGGVGNLYDRMSFGVVRDFLHMLPDYHLPFGWTWPRSGSPEVFPWVFNLADVMLLCGMGLLLIHLNLSEKRRSALETEQVPDSSSEVEEVTTTREELQTDTG